VQKSELFENQKSSHYSISHQYFSIFWEIYFGDIHLHEAVIANSRKLFFSLSNIDFSDLGLTFSIGRAALIKFPVLIKFLSVHHTDFFNRQKNTFNWLGDRAIQQQHEIL
jgi:hypothetical protein